MAAPKPVLPTTIPKPRSNAPGVERRANGNAFLLAVALALVAPLAASAAGVREDRPNFVGGELLGRGVFVTANYERFLTNHFGVGAGVTAAPMMTLYGAYLPGDERSLYLSAGALVLLGGDLFGLSPTRTRLIAILQASVGYQYQFPSGFFVRPLITYNQSTVGEGHRFLFWPGVTIGGSF